MRTRHPHRPDAGLLLPLPLPLPLPLLWLLWCALASPALAQEPQRFIVEPRDPSPATSPHFTVVNAVSSVGGQIYHDTNFPRVGGNMVAALIDPVAAADLRQTRPDLRVVPDTLVVPTGAPGSPWSPDRIDQRLGTNLTYLPPLIQPCGERRPFVYICDTGVRGDHDEFAMAGLRLSLAGSYIPATLPRVIPAWQDPWDHGTGVASCALGETLGAGRCPANLVSAVCYPDPGGGPAGTFASFAADVIYWALNEHNNRADDDDPFNDASVLVFASTTTTGPSVILDLAVQRAFLGGMSVVVAAGNDGLDVTTTSPAGATSGLYGDITLTVAASTVLDTRWSSSNYGPGAELFAPGESVPVASALGTSTCILSSGTSYSTGYAGGAAARILSRNPWATPVQVATLLTNHADGIYGPSGPFGAGPGGVPTLLFVNPTSEPCVPLTFKTWMDFHGTSPDGANDDPDCDELPNGVEYFMALNPMVPAGEGEHPTLSYTGGGAEFHFRKADFLCGLLPFEVQYSTDLSSWMAVAAASIAEDPLAPCVDGATWMVATIPAAGERVFARLAVFSP